MSLLNIDRVKIDESSLQNQVIAAIIANLGSLSYGAAVGWLSPMLDVITSDDSPLGPPMTSIQVAFAGGIFCLGGLVGLSIFTIIASKYGRKAAAYCIGLPLAIGLLFKLCASSVIVMLMGRFVCGVGGGGGMSLPTLLVGECCTPHIRGLLAALLVLFYSLGLITAFVLGAYLPFRIFTAVLMVMPIIFLICYWFIPETPVFLLKTGKVEEAAKAIAWFRKIPADGGGVRAELLRISRQLRGAEPINIEFEPTNEALAAELEWIQRKKPEYEQKMLSEHSEYCLHERPNSWKLLFTSPVARKGLLLCIFLVISPTLMGMIVLDSYSTLIFEKAETGLSSDACAISYSVIFLIGTTVGSLLMDKIGRRPLQIITSVVVCFGQGILAWCFQEPSAPKWLPFFGLFIGVVAFNAGPGIMPFVIASEVFANEVRDAATSVVMGFIWLTTYLLLQIFPLAVEALDIHVVFYFFSFVSMLGAIFWWFVLPETKGYTQEEILQRLAGSKPSRILSANESMIKMPNVSKE